MIGSCDEHPLEGRKSVRKKNVVTTMEKKKVCDPSPFASPFFFCVNVANFDGVIHCTIALLDHMLSSLLLLFLFSFLLISPRSTSLNVRVSPLRFEDLHKKT